jgi:hypothetical protein
LFHDAASMVFIARESKPSADPAMK